MQNSVATLLINIQSIVHKRRHSTKPKSMLMKT